MFSVAPFLFLLAVLVSPSLVHSIGNATCGLSFQEHIQRAIEIKKDCGYATFSDCCEMKIAVALVPSGYMQTGIYNIYDPCQQIKLDSIQGYSQARCDMDTDNGGWLVIQRRVEGGTVDFYRDWNDYEKGFGDLNGEFWYGLHNIHCLTNSASVEMRMDMEDESGNKITWTYQTFRVEGPATRYVLRIGEGEGTPGTTDSMAYHNNRVFMTHSTGSCAQSYKGGWWYYRYNCAYNNPNGVHDSSAAAYARVSSQTTGSVVYYPNYEMKIRPKSCSYTPTFDICA